MLFLCSWLMTTVVAVTLIKGENLDGSGCAEDGDCLSECKEKCGCNRLYYYNETLEDCVLNVEYLENGMTEKNNAQDFSDVHNHNEDDLAKKLEKEAEKAFQGILISVMLFGVCAIICTLSAYIYCCRINYTDGKLRKDVEALAQKLNRDGKSIKPKKAPIKPVAQSCNIIVEDAGVFVV